MAAVMMAVTTLSYAIVHLGHAASTLIDYQHAMHPGFAVAVILLMLGWMEGFEFLFMQLVVPTANWRD
jgi:hypothetical protein